MYATHARNIMLTLLDTQWTWRRQLFWKSLTKIIHKYKYKTITNTIASQDDKEVITFVTVKQIDIEPCSPVAQHYPQLLGNTIFPRYYKAEVIYYAGNQTLDLHIYTYMLYCHGELNRLVWWTFTREKARGGWKSGVTHYSYCVTKRERKVHACTFRVDPVLEAKLITQILKARATKQAVCPVQSETCYTNTRVWAYEALCITGTEMIAFCMCLYNK